MAASPFLWNLWIRSHYGPDIFQPADVPSARVAIVFGARIHPDGRLSPMLRDRVDTAVWLYQAGRVEKLLFSGDSRSEDYDEPRRMMDYALVFHNHSYFPNFPYLRVLLLSLYIPPLRY